MVGSTDEAVVSDEQLPRLLRSKDVEAMIGTCRRQIDRLEAAKDFPRRIHITPRTVGWLEHEVAAWIKERASRRRLR